MEAGSSGVGEAGLKLRCFLLLQVPLPHFLRVGLVSPDAHAFLLSGLLAVWGCGSSIHNLERLSSHWQFTAEYEDILKNHTCSGAKFEEFGHMKLFPWKTGKSPALEVEKAKGVVLQ